MNWKLRFLVTLSILFGSRLELTAEWVRHTIDKSSRGADGVRVMDINHDEFPDLVTGWEEGGKIRIYLNPGPDSAKEPWPSQTVGNVKSPEDAVFVDLDGDGRFEVVSSCEGKTRSVFLHWNSNDNLIGENSNWKTGSFPAVENHAQWMFAVPMNVDEQHGIDLILAAKGEASEIGWLQSPKNSFKLEDWAWHPLMKVGWVMSIETKDMNHNGSPDILYSDRKSSTRGIHWLENNRATDPTTPWARHTIGATDREVMFLSLGDLNHDNLLDVAATVKDGPITWFERKDSTGRQWIQHEIELPQNTGSGKGVAIADIDLDGRNDLVFTCEHAAHKIGVGWLKGPAMNTDQSWASQDISGTEEGVKFDLIQMLDLDHDGDLDVVTCEERDNLGVIWYENPIH